MNLFAGASNNSLAGTSNGATNNLGPGGRSFRSDLLVAADSVTNAMSTLVRELNSGTDLDLFSVEYLSKRQTQLIGYDLVKLINRCILLCAQGNCQEPFTVKLRLF